MITPLSAWDMHVLIFLKLVLNEYFCISDDKKTICKERQNSEKIWCHDNPQKLGKVYFLKSENVTKFPQKKKKKNQGLWLRQWQKPNKSNRMLCLHKTAIKKSEILQYESRHHRIHCSFYFFILSLLFILFFFFKPNTYALPSQLHFTHHHFRCWSDDELWPLNMRPHVDCILREGRKAYMCITLRGKCVNICVNMRHTRDMGGTA